MHEILCFNVTLGGNERVQEFPPLLYFKHKNPSYTSIVAQIV